MKRLAFLLLVIPMLACGQYITPTPTATEVPNTPTIPTPTPFPTSTPEPVDVGNATQEAVTVLQAVVNVRSEPGGAVVGSLAAGDPVTVTGCADNWCEISQPISGFVWMGCLSNKPDGLGCEAR
jgi:hypothetical protein